MLIVLKDGCYFTNYENRAIIEMNEIDYEWAF